MDIGLSTSLYSVDRDVTSSVQFYICDKEDKRVRLRVDNSYISPVLVDSYDSKSGTNYSNRKRDVFCFVPKSGRYYLRAIFTVVHKSSPFYVGRASITLESFTIQD
jgi:hypothetical protein